METTVFNPTQLHLLRLFSHDKSEETLHEVQVLLSDYYHNKVDHCSDELWDAGILDQKKLDELRGVHLRDLIKK